MLTITPIPAFKDNYIWLLRQPDQRHAVVVDPGDAEVALKHLQTENIVLSAIFITHHHQDHSGGAMALRQHFQAPVYGPAHENVAAVTYPLQENELVHLPELRQTFQVLDIPGHTRGHIAFYNDDAVFCGDTLFSAGCGRTFEGTAAQLFFSLQKLAALPDNTHIYCGHEYTQANLRFAETVEPENVAIKKRMEHVAKLRAEQRPTLPSTLAIEKLTNPFLRCHEPGVQQSVAQHYDKSFADVIDVFAHLRQWKDKF